MKNRGESLCSLAKETFGDLTAAEVKVLQAAALGEDADCQTNVAEEDDPARAHVWGEDRTVRADLLRWLCVDATARASVDPQGIRVAGVRIDGALNLDYAEVPFPIAIVLSALPDSLTLQQAHLAHLNLRGSHTGSIHADGIQVDGLVSFHSGFHATGEVRLLGAKIGGQLRCRGGRFENPTTREAPEATALGADGLEVGQDVYLDKEFHATGEVRLVGAKIGGQLSCRGARFENPPTKEAPEACALNACGLELGGDVYLDNKFHATGVVRLLAAKIGGHLECSNGRFENPLTKETPEASALSIDGLEVGGNVNLGEGFHATGEVRLLGAKIGGQLLCHGHFENPRGVAISLQGAEVKDVLFMDKGFKAAGEVELVQARVHVLTDAERTWPAPGNLRLAGFTYDAIENSPLDAKRRLKWIDLQYPDPKKAKRLRGTFNPQPYEQLAAVLRRQGHPSEAKKVLIAQQVGFRKYGDLGLIARMANWFWGFMVSYGYDLKPAVIIGLAVVVFGGILFGRAHDLGLLSMTKEQTTETSSAGGAVCAVESQRCFNPLVYSLDAFLPVVNLHQEEFWLPHHGRPDLVPAPPWGGTWGDVACIYLWFHIGAGWFITTVLIAGLTGLVRRD